MRFASLALTGLLVLAAHAAYAQTTILYEGTGNHTPDQAPWNWNYAQLPSTPNVIGTASGNMTNLNTTASSSLKAGYSRFAPFVLDNITGYDVTFDMQVLSEAHSSPNRAGCDVIVLGNDSKGVELAFWTDTVWAQTNTFTHAAGTETQAFDTLSGLVHYDLHVQNDTYTLSGNAVSLLSGSLHSYPAGPGTPYSLTNFLFIGDDTTSANASFNLARVTAAVPEPASFAWVVGMGISGAGFLACHRRKIHKAA